MIYDFGFTIWQAAFVLPEVDRILEIQPRADAQPVEIVYRKWDVRLPGIAPGHAPWREAILLLNHNRGN
jgi:hypothetical protein